ncbi:hypothetical protein CB0940_10631 [Cercospora beticola]|uniref:Uncharacterized protein n=1 Tax=Cercospora beticola TaxID=122368 RepID=A0A2G5HTF6_CERBT|nr:hypothetical protein CB0940_10631 [Cercospora beticola]PIA95806.1 hypothetical protein CB0940_10631 [Cercospora beticola]WPB07357.1 hypothetical protein RHO25_012018 [Cercospora beticola]
MPMPLHDDFSSGGWLTNPAQIVTEPRVEASEVIATLSHWLTHGTKPDDKMLALAWYQDEKQEQAVKQLFKWLGCAAVVAGSPDGEVTEEDFVHLIKFALLGAGFFIMRVEFHEKNIRDRYMSITRDRSVNTNIKTKDKDHHKQQHALDSLLRDRFKSLIDRPITSRSELASLTKFENANHELVASLLKDTESCLQDLDKVLQTETAALRRSLMLAEQDTAPDGHRATPQLLLGPCVEKSAAESKIKSSPEVQRVQQAPVVADAKPKTKSTGLSSGSVLMMMLLLVAVLVFLA